jgi:transketolase
MVGDAYLQEGVALEAISFAGHLKLNNLTVIYDNNQITCDGSVDLTNTEDVNAKMRACGWDVMDVQDGWYERWNRLAHPERSPPLSISARSSGSGVMLRVRLQLMERRLAQVMSRR